MVDVKLSALTALAAGPAETDEIYIRDVSEAAADESKRITAVELLNPENFTELAAQPAGADELFINDSGTGKKITVTNLMLAAGGGGAVTREGGNTTEATTTSTSLTDILNITGLSIAAGVPIWTYHNIRKTTGAANNVHAQLQVNTTLLQDIGSLETNNAAEAMTNITFIGARATNYQTVGLTLHLGANSPGVAGSVTWTSGSLPIATVTDLDLHGRSQNAAITCGVDEYHIYSGAVT